jgi:hypothetical protein
MMIQNGIHHLVGIGQLLLWPSAMRKAVVARCRALWQVPQGMLALGIGCPALKLRQFASSSCLEKQQRYQSAINSALVLTGLCFVVKLNFTCIEQGMAVSLVSILVKVKCLLWALSFALSTTVANFSRMVANSGWSHKRWS